MMLVWLMVALVEAWEDIPCLSQPRRYSKATVDIHGLDSFMMTDIPITTCACKLKCAKTGKTLIAFWNQYVCQEQADGYGTGQSIHSVAQLEDFGLKVHDKITEGNTQIVHPDGYEFSMYVRGGLCYIPQKRCTVKEFGKYDHILMTSDMGWNPENMTPKNKMMKVMT
jgi:hypothetical protein